ncbi:MAG: hypothetical protein AAGJ40_09730 [Planctomycetota bacterium]
MNCRYFVAEEVFIDDHVWGTVQGHVYYIEGELGSEVDDVEIDATSFVFVSDSDSEELPVRLNDEAARLVAQRIEEVLRGQTDIGLHREYHMIPVYVLEAAGKYEVQETAAA